MSNKLQKKKKTDYKKKKEDNNSNYIHCPIRFNTTKQTRTSMPSSNATTKKKKWKNKKRDEKLNLIRKIYIYMTSPKKKKRT